MTEPEFIGLLCAYIVVVALNFTVGRFIFLPDYVVKAKPNREEILRQKSKVYLLAFTITQTLVIGCGMVGIVGMFVFWKVAPWLFAYGVVGKIVLFPNTMWQVRSGLERMFSEIELLLDGVILTAVFFGPARHLF